MKRLVRGKGYEDFIFDDYNIVIMIIAKLFFGLLVDSKTIKKLSKSRYTDRFWNAISYRIHLFPYHPSLVHPLRFHSIYFYTRPNIHILFRRFGRSIGE